MFCLIVEQCLRRQPGNKTDINLAFFKWGAKSCQRQLCWEEKLCLVVLFGVGQVELFWGMVAVQPHPKLAGCILKMSLLSKSNWPHCGFGGHCIVMRGKSHAKGRNVQLPPSREKVGSMNKSLLHIWGATPGAPLCAPGKQTNPLLTACGEVGTKLISAIWDLGEMKISL